MRYPPWRPWFRGLLEHEVPGCLLGTDPFLDVGGHFYPAVLGKLLPVQLGP